MDFANTIISALTVTILAAGLYLAVRRFGLRRERFAFLRINLNAKVMKQVGDLLLVSVIVQLENRGQTRISARGHQDRKGKESDFLYDDGFDQCKHAGTLKIRHVPDKHEAELFDWYSLQPLTKMSASKVGEEFEEGDFEQINYLDEYQDPETQFADVDFWLEPCDVYDQLTMIWLPPGTYAMKAYFLGKMARHQEEEYWSCTSLFELKANKENA